MESSPNQAVVERLAALERENRRILWICGTVFFGALLLVGEGSGLFHKASTLEARELVLKDQFGAVRARFGVGYDGSAKLALLDRTGREQAALGATLGDSASLSFYEHGRIRVLLSALPDGASALRFFAGSDGAETALLLRPNSGTGLMFANPKQNLFLGLQPDGAAAIRILDEYGKEQGQIRLTPEDLRALGLTRIEPQDRSDRSVTSPSEPSRRAVERAELNTSPETPARGDSPATIEDLEAAKVSEEPGGGRIAIPGRPYLCAP